MKLVYEKKEKKYMDIWDKTLSKTQKVTVVREEKHYHYKSELERIKHKKEMEEKGWTDSGQIKETISGNIMQPETLEYVWCGKYYKEERK